MLRGVQAERVSMMDRIIRVFMGFIITGVCMPCNKKLLRAAPTMPCIHANFF